MKILNFTLIFFITAFSFTSNKATAQSAEINFSVFQNQLSPYGTWINNPRFGEVWVYNDPSFRPYATNGHWDYTNYGWSWVSDFDWGWAPFHYGRWEYDPSDGWMWIPGYQWAGAWVSWSQYDDYYGWAPLGYGLDIGVTFGAIPYNRWNFIPRQYMGSRDFYNHYTYASPQNNYFRNAVTINNYYSGREGRFTRGPERNEVERFTSNLIEERHIDYRDRLVNRDNYNRGNSNYWNGRSDNNRNGQPNPAQNNNHNNGDNHNGWNQSGNNRGNEQPNNFPSNNNPQYGTGRIIIRGDNNAMPQQRNNPAPQQNNNIPQQPVRSNGGNNNFTPRDNNMRQQRNTFPQPVNNRPEQPAANHDRFNNMPPQRDNNFTVQPNRTNNNQGRPQNVFGGNMQNQPAGNDRMQRDNNFGRQQQPVQQQPVRPQMPQHMQQPNFGSNRNNASPPVMQRQMEKRSDQGGGQQRPFGNDGKRGGRN